MLKLEGLALGTTVVCLELAIVVAVNPASGLPFVWFLLLTLAAHRVFVGRWSPEAIILFGSYAGGALALYWFQRITLPEYHGFSGGFGIGTDDSFYYSLAADSLPGDFPVRPDYYLREHQYPALLRASTPFPIRHPLDILFFNVVGLSLIPPLTARVASFVSDDQKIGRIAYGLVLVCPLVLMNGAVLTRDGVTAGLFIGSIALFLERRFIRAGILGLLLFYFRIASGLQLVAVTGVLALGLLGEFQNRWRRAAFVLGGAALATVGGFAVYPVVLPRVIEAGFLTTGVFRTQIIDTFLSLTPDASVLTTLGGLPAIVRAPIGFAYFLAGPFLGLDQLVIDSVLVPRAIMNTAFALLSMAYIKFFVQGVLSAASRGGFKLRSVAAAYLLAIALISQLSLIIRHKTMLMPLFYILVAYGIARSVPISKPFGNAAALALLALQAINLWM